MNIKSLIRTVLSADLPLRRLTDVWDRLTGESGRVFRFRTAKLWHSHSHRKRVSYLGLAALLSFSILLEPLLLFHNANAVSKITPQINQLLVEAIPLYSNFLNYDGNSQYFEYNKGYKSGGVSLGTKASPKFSGRFPLDGSKGIDVNDPSSGATIKVTPDFAVGMASRDQNRLVYPLPGRDALKVVSLGGIGYKEDIVLNSFQGSSVKFEYELDIPDGVEARLENDGSVAFYGVQSELLGNVSTGTDADAQLLKSALENGDKNNLLFKIPAPYVVEYGRRDSVVDTFFELNGNRLTTVATNLAEANYPLSIDPSVYVETARKFMRGNEESNVDFDVDNELIQKGTTTGARFDSWVDTMALNESRFDGASAVAGGFVYQVGGVNGSAVENTTVFSVGTGQSFNVPAGVTSITVKLWGGAGGGGAGGSLGAGGAGGGGGYTSATFSVTPLETLTIDVGGGGGGGTYPGSNSGGGGGGGGHSEVRRGGTVLALAAGGGGGGGGDNSSGGAFPGGDGGAGGDENAGLDGSSSGAAGGGGGATDDLGGTPGAGGTGGGNPGSAGASQSGGAGADGNASNTTDGSENNGGVNNGDGDGGTGNTGGFGGGGGGGSGYFGGGGGSGSASGDNGGGGGGGGIGYTDPGVSAASYAAGSGTTPGNSIDADRSGAADGGGGGGTTSGGTAGDNGRVVVKYYSSVTNTVEDTVFWASINDTNGTITSPNPGAGACTNWCTDSAYDLPEERRAFSLVAYNGFLYAIGGEDSAGNTESTVFIAKIGANGEPSLWHPTDDDRSNWVYWYEDTAGALTTAKKYTSVVAYNNRLYILGGATDANPGGTSTVEYTSLSPTGTLEGWTSTGTSPLSGSRFMHSAETYNGYLYVVGGDSSSSGNLLNTVEYVKLASDGTFAGSWESTSSFSGARRTNGDTFTTIYGAYMYITGGCTAVTSGDCQAVGNEVQIASIFADGSLGNWSTDSNETNQRLGYGLHSWQGYIYRIGGCTIIVTTGNDCVSSIDTVSSGEINPPGEVSTVNVSTDVNTGDCSGGSPINCHLPPPGDDAGEIGQLLSATIILNGYLYVIGGCIDYDCDGTNPAGDDADLSGNIAYVSIAPDGSLERATDCVASGNAYAGSGNSAWCVDSTNRVNGTTGIAATGIATFNNQIYLIGGLDGTTTGNQAYFYNGVNNDGSLDGSWSSGTLASIGISGELAYTYAYARANPSAASTTPANLFVVGGCTGVNSDAGCGGYGSNVYKCNIAVSGNLSGCTTSGQLQIDSDIDTGGVQGIAAHAGTVYANRIYIIGGLNPDPDGGGPLSPDRDETMYAVFDDNNNIVNPDTGLSSGNWIDSGQSLSAPRRRGSGFGYNGHLYAVGGFDQDTGTLPLIEWSKLNVSTGGIDPYTTSNIEITQRWGLSIAISNSFAYVIGGCDDGDSPTGCQSFIPVVQTFQLYNNDSGAPANYEESTGDFTVDNDRIGSSAAILDGYIYVAGGEASGSALSNVQYAPLNANGTIGAWSSTTASLPAARAYGHLEAVGGSLYYIGGEDTAGDEKSEVYYATPTSGVSSNDVIRTTTYKFSSGEFTGTSYTLTLDQDLTSDYYVMVAGASTDSSGNNGPDNNQIRVDLDPHGNFGSSTASDAIRLARGSSTSDWVGSVTVVECVSSCDTDGFELYEVLDTSLASGNTLTDDTLSGTPSDFSNVVPFGAYLGGGLETTESGSNFSGTAGVEISKTGTNTIRFQRDNTADTAAAAEVTTYVVEWGSNWNVQDATFSAWSAGGQGVDATGEYTTEAFDDYTSSIPTAVDPDNTWVWKSPGRSSDDGLGRGSFGKVLMLGDGVNQGSTETTVALSSETSGFSKNDTVYVMEHSSLAVDYRFLSRGGYGTSNTVTVDTLLEPQSVGTVGNITVSGGYALPLFYYTDSGNGDNYPKVAGWDNYHSNDTTISISKSFDGNDQSGWMQSVDFGATAGNAGAVDITTWSTASNGLPADRTRHGAAVWNDRIYVVGGLDDSASETNTVYISPKLSSGGDITSAWASDADVPDVARSGGAVIAYANNLYFLGGNDGTNYLSDVQFTSIGYKTGTIAQSGTTVTGTGTSWTASMVGEEIQYADGSTATIVTFSSATSITVDASKSVDPGTRYLIDDGSVGNWTFTTSLPQFVSDGDGFAANGFMYIIGGRSSEYACTNNTYVAPISANTTIDSGNNPTGVGEWYQTNIEFTGNRRNAAVAYNDGRVYLSGGGCDEVNTLTYGQFSFDADNDADESAWTFVSDNGSNGLNPSNTARAWSHETGDTASGNVGPESGQAGDPDGYVYTEASSPAAAGDTFTMTFNTTLDASTYDWEVEFYWNQRGDDNTATVQLQTNENSAGWTTEATYGSGGPDVPSSGAQVWNQETLDLSSAVSDASTEVRFLVTLGSTGNIWNNDFGLDSITIRGAEPPSGPPELTDNQHYVGTLRAQPQIARYSYYIDADSDVFPNAWLLNGLDNNIGARWQFGYRSSTDSASTWGQNTNFGDVTLGRVEGYTPRDGAGTDTEFARYYYLTISIDASQTFGYPDDVSRGPTIDDMTLFFTSDPNKRLRHGKTFIQGTEQPLDTPCRVSGANPSGSQPNCPLP